MKRLFISLVAVCAVCGTMAQSITSYYMPDAIERRNHNIAFAPERGYLAIPLVGSTTIGLNGNVSVSSLIYQNANGDLVSLLDSGISSSEALGNLNKGANFTALESRFEVLNFGGYCKDKSSFWSFNIGLRSNASVNVPYELFEFVKKGKESNMGNINMYMESFVDVGFGLSKTVNDKLNIGGRVKVLVGLASANLNISKFDVEMNSEQWSVDAEGNLDMYGPGLVNEGAIIGDEFDYEDLDMGSIKPAGIGVALDLGMEYELIRKLKLSLAVNDLGFIKWNQDCNVSATMATTQTFNGVDISGDGTIDEPDFSFDDMTLNNSESKSSTRLMQASVNMGGEYSFLNELIGVGAVYSIRFWEAKTMHNVSLMGNLRPVSWFTLGASYGISNGSNTLGLAMNFSPTWFNLYVATDIITAKKSAQYIPIDQSAMNLSLGMAIPIGKRSLRSKYTKWTSEE
ncbi:MAG: DUF5723 family protein [Rikenellaceae bacterium]